MLLRRRNIMSGLSELILFDNGYVNTKVIGGFTGAGYWSSKFILTDIYIRMQVINDDGSYGGRGYANNAVDITKYSTVQVIVTQKQTNACRLFVNTAKNTSVYKDLVVGTNTYDISSKSGLYYIGLGVIGGSGYSYVTKLSLLP